MNKVYLALTCCLMLVSCMLPNQNRTNAPEAGEVVLTKTDTNNGTTETITFKSPELAEGKSVVEYDGLKAEFSKQGAFELPEISDFWPQRMLYGTGVLCILAGAGFVGFGKHFKLGAISAITGVGILALAVFIKSFSVYIALAAGGVFLLSALFVGWFLWKDYQDGELDLKISS